MPRIEHKEKVIKVTISSDNRREFDRWSKFLIELFRNRGIYITAKPPAKIGEEYVMEIYIGGTPDIVKDTVSFLGKLKTPEGAIYHGEVYRLPPDVNISLKMEEKTLYIRKTGKTIKTIKAPGTVEEELVSRAGMERFTIIARSKKLDALSKFVDALVSDLNKNKCPVTRSEIYRCVGEFAYKKEVQAVDLSRNFVCKPGYVTHIEVIVPVKSGGAITVINPIKISYEPVTDFFKEAKELFIRYPELMKGVEEGLNWLKLKKKYPELASKIPAYLMDKYNQIVDMYQHLIRVCDFLIDVAPESKNMETKPVATISIDGETVISGEKIPLRKFVFGTTTGPTFSVFTPDGKPKEHTINVHVSGYYVREVEKAEYYEAVIWALVDKKCYNYLYKIREKNPKKIILEPGRHVMPSLTGCEKISPQPQR